MSFWRKTCSAAKFIGEVAFRLAFANEEGLTPEEQTEKEKKEAEARRIAREEEEARRASLTPEQRKMEDLERENARLRSQNSDLRDACRKQQDTLDAVKRWAEENS